eukprot:TRINITY_DN1801_c1_g1_i2.p1 TRINITY_DN1801_c1_g1~~TRINITY_DN1801_c1_g1_i2.p1  ORF type:complete len:382 (-),score=180.94 TRINITY_DN1801_c1_g1_i2:1195-2340(-)
MNFKVFIFISFLSLINLTSCIDNGLGLTPQMGWNSWNYFHCNVSEDLIKQTADALVSTGLATLGYRYVNIDDCWQVSRDSSNRIVADPVTFPSGIAALAEYVHSKGLLFGLYSDAGNYTCQDRPGSLGYEEIDAQTYADWKVDYLKYDNCNNGGISPKIRYPPMRDALNKTGRPIFYSICEWGRENPATWAPNVGNSWRTTPDISDNWYSMIWRIQYNNLWWKYAGPGAWNDPDMLEVGNGGMTSIEYKTHFSLWSIAKSPLIIGCDVRNIDKDTLTILSAVEVIAINQDSLGVQGHIVNETETTQIWSGPLSGNRYSLLLLNKGRETTKIVANWSDLGLDTTTKYTVRDIWERENIGVYSGSFEAIVESHDVFMGTLTAV